MTYGDSKLSYSAPTDISVGHFHHC